MHDPRMHQARHRPGFVLEAPPRSRLRGDLPLDQLQGVLRAQHRMPHRIDLAHASPAQQTQHLVTPEALPLPQKSAPFNAARQPRDLVVHAH
jgi:hypothetical protein